MNGVCARPDVEEEIQLIQQRIKSEEQLKQFVKLYQKCENSEQKADLSVVYRHLLPEFYNDQSKFLKDHQKLGRPLHIGYLLNEDVVFCGDLDMILCNCLRNEGALVTEFKTEDFFYKASQRGIDIYIKNKAVKFDGFMSYGYRKQFSMENYMHISRILQESGVVCLLDSNTELILNNKLTQSIYFAKAKIPIPETFQSFGLPSLIRFFDEGNKVPCVVKQLSDYCGDGVNKIDYKNHVVSYVSKSLWKQENVLVQKFIADSIGRSIRAICFQNRVTIVFHQISKSGDFRSNLDCDDFYSVEPITNDAKSEVYKDIAQRACNSIGSLTVAGVDLIDSPSDGVLVLEINSFPELFESWEATGICTVKKFIQAFMNKVENSIVR